MSDSQKPYAVTFSGYIFEPWDRKPFYPPNWETAYYDTVVSMFFAPPTAGWVDWAITGTGPGTKTWINFSNWDDPFPKLIDWLIAVTENSLPAGLRFDLEGVHVVIWAYPVTINPDWFELMICFEDNPEQPTFKRVAYWARVAKKQFIREFLRRFKDWLANDYNAGEWHLFGKLDPEEEDERIFPCDPHTLSLAPLEEVVAPEPSAEESLYRLYSIRQEPREKIYVCPLCRQVGNPLVNDLEYVCRECFVQACDAKGRKLKFYNLDYGGGYQAIYADTSEPYLSHICFIRSVRCRADEYRMGGIVIVPYEEGEG